MPINPFPESIEKHVIRIRDGFDLEGFRVREFNGVKLKYFGMPSAELLDILAWKDHISGITAIERDIDILKDIRKSIFNHKLEKISNVLAGDICDILKNKDIGKNQIFNLDFYGGFVHKREDGSASIPEAINSLIKKQADYRESFILLMTFNLRDDDKIEYDEYIENIKTSLHQFPVKNLEKNIKFHISEGKPSNIYKLKLCVPCFVYISGLPKFEFNLKRIYHYKNFVHFVIEMKFVKDKTLGVFPNIDNILRILNIQILEIHGRLPMTKTPQIPYVML
jgi:hypothetical protein